MLVAVRQFHFSNTTLRLPFLLIGAQLDAEPLKVFILAGESNMEGAANISTLDYIGDDPASPPLLATMRDEKGNPKPRAHTCDPARWECQPGGANRFPSHGVFSCL